MSLAFTNNYISNILKQNSRIFPFIVGYEMSLEKKKINGKIFKN